MENVFERVKALMTVVPHNTMSQKICKYKLMHPNKDLVQSYCKMEDQLYMLQDP